MCVCLDYTHTHKPHLRRGKKYLFDGNGMPIIVQVTACVFLGGFWCVVRAIAPSLCAETTLKRFEFNFAFAQGRYCLRGGKWATPRVQNNVRSLKAPNIPRAGNLLIWHHWHQYILLCYSTHVWLLAISLAYTPNCSIPSSAHPVRISGSRWSG